MNDETPYKFRQRLLAMNQAHAASDRRENYGYRSRLPWEERLPWEKYVMGSERGVSCSWRNYLPPSSQACFEKYTKSWWERNKDLNKQKKKRKAEGKTKLSLETPPLKKHKATPEQYVVKGFHKEEEEEEEKKIINSEEAVQDDDQVVIFKRLPKEKKINY